MNENLEKLIEELCRIDPELRREETALRRVLSELLRNRPEVVPDHAFRMKLRERLIGQAPSPSGARFPLWGQWLLVGAGVAAAVLISVAYRPAATPLLLSSEEKVNLLGSRAFGPLALADDAGQDAQSRESSAKSAPPGLGGGVSAGSFAAPSLPSPTIVGGMGGGGEIGPVPPEYVNAYRFEYRGEPLELPDAELMVFRRAKGERASTELMGLLSRTGTGFIDLGAFRNARLQSFNLIEEDRNGYSVFVNMQESTVSISENRAYSPKMVCPNGDCDSPPEIGPEVVPGEEELIRVADAFLEAYGIPRDAYGEPYAAPLYEGPMPMIYPPITTEFRTVVYPVFIRGQEVYRDSGDNFGLTVTVNYRGEPQVTNVEGLSTRVYDSSAYPAERDAGRIIRYAERTGSMFVPPDASSKTVGLGTPSWGLLQVVDFREGETVELYVPALIFPLLDRPQGFYPRGVVVPLIKEILDQREGPSSGIMPFKSR